MATAALIALASWWGATQALILAVRALPAVALNTLAVVLAAAGAAGAVAVADDASMAGAYGGFAAALALWGAFEVAFLSGAVLGIHRPAHSTTLLARAWSAYRAILHHEAGLVVTLAVLVFAFGAGPNPMAAATFGLLYAMRASAKVNLFLGVRNACPELLPPAVAHLAQHFRCRPINPLFPLSVAAGALAAAFLLRAALAPDATDGAAVGAMLLAVLAMLGTLEHWLMLTPLSPARLFAVSARVTLTRPLGVARTMHT